MIQRALLLFGLLGALAGAGCGDNVGDTCTSESDCSGSLICAQFVVCADTSCPGTCADTCDSDEDCGAAERCFAEPSGARTFCRYDALAD